MSKLIKTIFLSGLLFNFSTLYGAEVKEIKILDDFTTEIIQDTKSTKKAETKVEKIKEETNKKSDTTSKVEKVEAEINPDSIVDTFEKEVKNGVAYKKESKERFTGYFGAVIDGKIDHYEGYKDGLLDGESAWFSKEGVKLLSEYYSKGKLNGEQKSYYENGKLKSIVKYVNGRVDGIVSYDQNGKILHESIFKDGNGTWKFYWSNGKISEEGKYTAWRKDGIWKKYREDGSLDMTTTYDKGRLLKERWE